MKNSEMRMSQGVLFTDQYQLTMAQIYFRMGLHENQVQFDHFFRNYPDYGSHKAGYCINAGMEWLLDWITTTHFSDEDIDYLRTQQTRSGRQLFLDDFLEWLRHEGNFSGMNIQAIPEGRVVHPNVPLTVVQGPLAMAQILETSLLNHLNYQTLVATKASRIKEIGRGQLLLEFGLRRGHHFGANAGARAALIGGADFSSNVGISAVLGYPPKGTHAHSMVQVFIALGMGELEAFRVYAEIYPDDCILLVDTVNTLESGIPKAIKVFEELRQKGHKPVGVRLDSGDLAYLSIQAAKQLNDAGFPDVKIVLSNNLDEMSIWQIITQIIEEASKYDLNPDTVVKRLVYGVGTRLITSWGEPALGGVYKMVAVEKDGELLPVIKMSESINKIPAPGNKHVWRIYDQRDKATVDLLGLNDDFDEEFVSSGIDKELTLHHPIEPNIHRVINEKSISEVEPLLDKVLEGGKIMSDQPTIEQIREQRIADVERLDAGVRRIMNPHIYHVSLTEQLWDLKQDLINKAFSNAKQQTDSKINHSGGEK